MERKARLESLDILRGIDMWLLLMVGPILGVYLQINSDPGLDWLRIQMEHASWEGFHIWDIIMPLFMFVSGVTIPFSMAKYRKCTSSLPEYGRKRPDVEFYKKLLKRIGLLFLFGWIVQGNLLSLDIKMFKPFSNTLQAIAVGYLFAVLLFVYFKPKWQIVLTAVPFAAYFLAFALTGMNLDNQENVAMLVDKAVLGCHRDGVEWNNSTWAYISWYDYTWILSSLNFIVTVMLGCFTGQILKNHRYSGSKKSLMLLGFGAALIATALLISPIFPIIKKIWSSSMTLLSGGISIILMALFYYIVDVREWNRGLGWLKYYGKNAIFAYMVGEIISFSSISTAILFGTEHIIGAWYPLVLVTADTFILFFILRHMYKKNVFLKV